MTDTVANPDIPSTGVAGDDSNLSRPGEFRPGDLALLLDRKSRRYMLTLDAAETFHSHLGRLRHDQLIGGSVGGWYRTDKGHTLLAVRPTLGDYVRQMPRGPQIIYQKDLGNIVSFADIFPGATVIEGGLGSGALTAALLRAVGPEGRVITYEIDESVLPKAMRNIRRVMPAAESIENNLQVKIGSVYEGIEERDVDRVVLDVPEPWQAVAPIAESLVMGGVMLSFLPTILQVHRLVGALEQDGQLSAHRVHGDAAAHLARDRAQRAPRPSHGGPQRLPDHRRPLRPAPRLASGPGYPAGR